MPPMAHPPNPSVPSAPAFFRPMLKSCLVGGIELVRTACDHSTQAIFYTTAACFSSFGDSVMPNFNGRDCRECTGLLPGAS